MKSLAEAGADYAQLLAALKNVREAGRKADVKEADIEKYATIYFHVKDLASQVKDGELEDDAPAYFIRSALGSALTEKL